MKYLLLPLVIVTGQAVACPGEGAKDAMAPAAESSLAAKTSSTLKTALASKPATAPTAKDAQKTVSQRVPQEQVAGKTLTEQGKSKAL